MRKQLLTRVEQGKPTDKVDNRPELAAFLRPVLEEFFALMPARPSGFGLAPIPPAAVEGHLDTLGIVGEERGEWRRYWRALDSKFLEHHRNKPKTKRVEADSKSPRRTLPRD